MPITKADLDNAKQDDDKRKADANQAKLKTKEKESNEAPRKAASDAVTAIRDKLNFKRGGTVKTKRYAVGGEADDTAKSEVFKNFKSGESKYERDDNEASSGPSSFKEAFAEARRRGDKTFMWNGERKTTELASSKPKPAPKAEAETPAAKESSGMGPKNTFLTKERMKVEDKSEGSTLDRIKEHLGNEFKKRPRAAAKEDEAPAKIGTQNFRASDSRRPTYEKGRSTEEWSKMLGKKKGGSVKSASARADGCAIRGKTRA